ncbi:TPM domain-containing protein [Pseudonocardia sp.]|uniref:TPM domain-containing protein n=1 Tax=Pseudonocardia sp. TaxID=60912 RepID=UPI003D0B3C37
MVIRRLLLPLVVLLLLAWPGIALADPPQRLDSDIVDRAGALTGDDTAQIRKALDALRAETGMQLFVVFVGSFDGATGQEWADDSARLSQLGPRDVLFAVAVEDRAYGLSVDTDLPVDQRSLDDLMSRDVEPRLAVGDWAGAVVALAEGLARGGAASGGAGGSSATPWIVGGAIALAGGAYVLRRRRRARAGAEAAGHGPPQAPDEHAGVSTEDLGYRASSALLELDDAVRTSEQELDLVRAQFGEEAVTGFRAALDASRADLVRAFGVRQQLDDEIPEDEPTKRAMLADILRTCAAADARLDEQAEDFDRLRDLERTAPDVVARLGPAVDAVAARVPEAQQQLATLRAAYAAGALGTVPDDVERARDLITAARTETTEAQAELAAGKRGEAVVSARAAEEATAQAGTLLGGVGRLADELAEAGARIADARAEVAADLAEARALAGGSAADLRAAVARAEAGIAAADGDLAAPLPDPLAALRRLTEAASQLDTALAAAREQRERDERARAALDGALLAARSAVAAASDFVATRRGAVGSEARTRLAEAQRHLDIATGQAASDPVSALAAAQRADALAREAQQRAESDVARWSAPPAPGRGAGTAIDLGSLVLGGILFGDDRGRGGAFGRGSGGWGGGGRGGFSPGSFGGSGTRGRRGTGGRF